MEKVEYLQRTLSIEQLMDVLKKIEESNGVIYKSVIQKSIGNNSTK